MYEQHSISQVYLTHKKIDISYSMDANYVELKWTSKKAYHCRLLGRENNKIPSRPKYQ